MQFLPEILIVCLLVFLYGIFILSKDNFILLRKNVTLEQLFNISFLCFFFGVFLARVFYVLENPSLRYLNPLVLLLFPYFPGLSFAGATAGGFLLLFYLTKRKKLPFWSIFDIFSLSFLLSVSVGFLLIFIINIILLKKILLILLLSWVAAVILFIIIFVIFSKNVFKDGSLGFLSLSLILFHQLIFRLFARGKPAFFRFAPEDIILGVFAIIMIVLAIWKENEQGMKKK